MSLLSSEPDRSESYAIEVPSVSGLAFTAGAFATNTELLHEVPLKVDLRMEQLEPLHDCQTTALPFGATAGLESRSAELLRFASGPDGFEMRPTLMSSALTKAT